MKGPQCLSLFVNSVGDPQNAQSSPESQNFVVKMVSPKNLTNFEGESIRLRRVGSNRQEGCSQHKFLLAPDDARYSRGGIAEDADDDEVGAGKVAVIDNSKGGSSTDRNRESIICTTRPDTNRRYTGRD